MILRKKSRLARASAIVLALAMLISTSAFAETIEDIQARQADLQAQTDTLNTQLDVLRGDEAEAQQYKQALDDSIALAQQRIDSARESIEVLNSSIKEREDKLALSEQEHAASMDLLKKRIKAIYETGNVGTLEILLDSKSFEEFSWLSETLKSFTAHDKALLSQIEAYMEATAEDRDALKVQKEAVAELKKQQEADQIRLGELMEENNQVISDLQVQQVNTEEAIANIEEEDEALNAQIAYLIEQERLAEEARRAEEARAAEEARLAEEARRAEEAANAGSGGDEGSSDEGAGDDSSGGDYVPEAPSAGGGSSSGGSGMSDGFSPSWPLPGYDTSWVTCWYGDGGHNGLDIAGGYGAPIIAAQAGKVISADYHYSWGNNVLLYHNGTYSTRYAHMSNMAVSAGQYVERGQTIGYVGSTGNSTGNHLHFEVYYNGSRVDPYAYL